MSSDIEAKEPVTGDQTGQDVPHNANYDEKAGSMVEIGESYTAEEERAVLRKIDFTILPMMCAVFFLQYLDKQSLSYASVRCLSSKESALSSIKFHLLTTKYIGLRPHHGFEYDEQAIFVVYLHILCGPASRRISFHLLDE